MSGRGEKFVVDFECVAIEADESDEFDGAGTYEVTNRFDCNTGCAVRWKGIDAGTDGGEGDGADVVLLRQFETAPVAAGEKIVFVAIASAPDGTDCVKDPLGGKLEAGCGFRVSGRAAVKFAAGLEKVRTSGTMDGTVDTATAEQRGVGGIHDGVDLFLRDVTLNCDEIGHAESPV
jgi:hypothetical protein